MKKFKKHMMYGPNGESAMANTKEMHLKYKNMGWGHSKKGKKGMKYSDGGMRTQFD